MPCYTQTIMNEIQKRPRQPGVSRVLRQAGMPVSMLNALEKAGVPHSRVLAAFPADLSAEGRFVERWMVVAADRFLVVEADGVTVPAQESFQGMTGVEYRKLVGGGIILVKRGGEQRELVRCSRAVDRAIQAALAKLRVHLELEKPGARPATGDEEKKKDAPAEPLLHAIPELPADRMRTFLEQLDEIDEQRHCATCGLPLKQDTSVCSVCVNPGRTLIRVLKLALPYHRILIGLCSVLGLMSLVSILPPLINGKIFDWALLPAAPGTPGDRKLMLLMLVGGWVGIELVQVGLRVLQGRLSVIIGAGVSRDLRTGVFNHLQSLSLAYFDRHKTGALMSRVSGDSQHLEGFLVDGVVWTVISLLQAAMVAVMLFWMNWKLGLLVLVPAPLVVIFTRLVWHRIMGRFRRLWEIFSRLSAALSDSLRGVRVVKSFGREEQEIGRFDRHNQAAREALVTAETTWALMMPFLQFIMGFGGYLVWLVGGSMVIGNFESPGTLVTFMGYTPMLYGPLGILTRVNQWFTRSMTAAERIFEILDTESEVPEAPDAVPMPDMKGRIELREATFGYEKHTPVIKRMSLTIEPGEIVGLVGHSGAGKSTTINLATRLYDVDEGQILIDNVDIRKIRIADLRRQTGVVLQETFLFSGTVYENIAYSRPDAMPEDVMNAAKMANAHGFIMDRPDGYDSEVEEGGNNFSSGEKQRLAIARAILHDPRILILDEATSSVDTKTEKQIQEAISRLTRGRTTIAIAHRLSTLRGANRLVVMEHGEVREVGTHEELMARKDGIYYDLVKTQTEMTSAIAVGM